MSQFNRLEQQQKLALTRSMQVSLEILQMDSVTLHEHINRELLENPFLESACRPPTHGSAGLARGTRAEYSMDSFAETLSLEDHLLEQMAFLRLSRSEQELAEKLVYCLDEYGMLGETPDELAGITGFTLRELDSTIEILQQLEPAGVFARDIKECLKLQLVKQDRFSTAMSVLLNHLELVAEDDSLQISKTCNVEESQAKRMIANIRSLTCCLRDDFTAVYPETKLPDLIFSHDDQQSILVELNPQTQPDILVNDSMFEALAHKQLPEPGIDYYRDCYHRASWLMMALQKRASTMLAIGREIARCQQGFLVSGKTRDLVPLTMETIAARLQLHKSTISRALSGRYIDTGQGILEASVFFVRRVNAGIKDLTVDHVLERLTEIIKSEHAGRIYSDRQICEQLAGERLAIGLRTVSKYRKILNIPTSYRRKRVMESRVRNANTLNFYR